VTPEQLAIVDAYRTCEFATVSRKGVPIAWPTTSVYRPAAGVFALSTSIGFAQKAYNVWRTPDVAMLFSDPTGSGVELPQQVLVQGTASCPDEVQTSFAANADLWRRIFAFQPSSRNYPRFALTRWLMDVYFMRLVITITPHAITSRGPIPTGNVGARLPPSTDAFARVVHELPGYPTSVLAAFDAAGRPTLTRVALRPESGVLVVDVPEGFDVVAGAASILSHGHDEKLWSLRSFVATGSLTDGADGWAFAPATFSPGSDGNTPAGVLRTVRALRAAGARFLAKRGLPRPKVAWAEVRDL
jgi:hypothetical protein